MKAFALGLLAVLAIAAFLSEPLLFAAVFFTVVFGGLLYQRCREQRELDWQEWQRRHGRRLIAQAERMGRKR